MYNVYLQKNTNVVHELGLEVPWPWMRFFVCVAFLSSHQAASYIAYLFTSNTVTITTAGLEKR
jgi:hypothetical protein